ncbi:xylulokinase [Metabacillus arenae]|uniref:Xylulose kinase n=1 Tax=Metabacillus arenae TaxID=2771434 RepID=A0A926RVK8_9BACI|nr:FGGY family carbohydrate kinase [Metabacillus arenae]MBD1379788.1 xylulose kinase [Metabacillus arenae]
MSHVIGIDIGSSSIKIGAINKEGDMAFVLRKPYSFQYLDQGRVEIDLDQIWKETKSLLQKAFEKVRRIGCVNAISLSTFCNSSVFMDQKGNPLYSGIVYLDKRSVDEADWIKNEVGEKRLYKVTRNRMEAGMYSVSTLLWMKKNNPEIFYQTYRWGNLSTFILHKLTGRFILDWTQASFSGIFNPVNYQWSEELCEVIGVPMRLLPEIGEPGSMLGDLIDFDGVFNEARIPVIVGGADTACSALALNIRPNEMFESVGTSDVLTVCSHHPERLDTRFLNRSHVIKNQWLSHGAMSTPGASISWFYNNFLKDEGDKSIALETVPEQSAIGANGVFFLPYMHGERTPIWDPYARGTFIGLQINTSKSDMIKAIFEGCAYGLKQINDIVEKKYQLIHTSFQSIGGGAKNRHWTQIKANVLNKQIEVKDVNETAVFGACLLAGIGASYFSSFKEAMQICPTKTIFTVEPEETSVKIYRELYELFCEIYPSLKSFFQKSSIIKDRNVTQVNAKSGENLICQTMNSK